MCIMKFWEWPSDILEEIYYSSYARAYLWTRKIRVRIWKCSLNITTSEENLSCDSQLLFDSKCKILTFPKISDVIHSPVKCIQLFEEEMKGTWHVLSVMRKDSSEAVIALHAQMATIWFRYWKNTRKIK